MATVLIGHASIDENGNITGGASGDQTGKEVCTRTWYSKPWDYIAIHPDATVREKHASCCEAACANDKIGYDQNQRNTLHTQAKAVNFDYSKITTKCECDCSSLQNSLAVASGSGATYISNGWTTSTMKAQLQKLGYIIITESKYLASADYCVRGAIYVKSGSHTVTGLTNGSKYTETLTKAGLLTPQKTSSSSGSSVSSSIATSTAKNSTTVVSSKTATEKAKSYNKSFSGVYKTTAKLNVRNGAGTNKSILVTIPKGTSVTNHGYYTTVSGVKWMYVQFTYNKVQYTGFCSKTYLTK